MINTDFDEEMEGVEIDVQVADDIALLTSVIAASSVQNEDIRWKQEISDNSSKININTRKTDEELRKFVEEQRNPNTNRKTIQVMNSFSTWLSDKQNGSRNIEEIDGVTLNNYIGNYLLGLRKKDGSFYEPDTLTSYHRGIERYLRDKGYEHNLMKSDLFKSSRDVLAAQRKNLK